MDWRGEAYSLSRWCDVKSKALKERLGEPQNLPSVDQVKDRIDQALVTRMQALRLDTENAYAPQLEQLSLRQKATHERQLQERTALEKRHAERAAQELKHRQARFSKGVRGLWHRVTGQHSKVKNQNEMDMYQSFLRDRAEKDALIFRHIEQRKHHQDAFERLHERQIADIAKLQKAVFSKLPDHQIEKLKPTFEIKPNRSQTRDFGMEMM